MIGWSFFLSLMLVCACHKTRQEVQPHLKAKPHTKTYRLDERILVQASWSAICSDRLDEALVFLLTRYPKQPEETSRFFCDNKQVEIETNCSSPCAVEVLPNHVAIVPLKSGPFSFDATMVRLETGEVKRYQSKELNIIEPDGIGLLCQYESYKKFEPCDSRPLDTQRPFGSDILYVKPFAEYSLKRVDIKSLFVNGNLVRTKEGSRYLGAMSLKNLFPNREKQSGIYEIEIVHGKKVARYNLEVK